MFMVKKEKKVYGRDIFFYQISENIKNFPSTNVPFTLHQHRACICEWYLLCLLFYFTGKTTTYAEKPAPKRNLVNKDIAPKWEKFLIYFPGWCVALGGWFRRILLKLCVWVFRSLREACWRSQLFVSSSSESGSIPWSSGNCFPIFSYEQHSDQ